MLESRIFLFYVSYAEKVSDQTLRNQNKRNAQREFWVFGFMADGVHPHKAADAATDNGHQYKRGFRNAPKIFLGFVLINKHKYKANCID